jgi:hypothetical protein
MEGVDYLKPEDSAALAEVIRNLSPENLTFLELTVPRPRAEVAANPGLYPPHMVSLRSDDELPDMVHIRQAGLWIVSGQSMYPHPRADFERRYPGSVEVERVHWQTPMRQIARSADIDNPHTVLMSSSPLPWQYDADLIAAGNLPVHPEGAIIIDRARYPITFEVGRTAQLGSEQIEPLFAMATTIVSQEIAHLQGNADQAYVFAAAMTPSRRRLFARFGFRPFEGGGGYIMVAPFTELARRFPPGGNSARVGLVRGLTENRLSHVNAMNVLTRAQTYFRAELDLAAPSVGLVQSTPIIVHDLSRAYAVLLQGFGQRFAGLSPEASLVFARELSRLRHDNSFNQASVDEVPIDRFQLQFTQNNVVRITNLDPRLAGYPEYLPTAILGVDDYLAYRFGELGFRNPVGFVESLAPVIAIQTRSIEIAAAASSLGGHALPPVQLENSSVMTYLFGRNSLQAMRANFPAVANARGGRVAQGFWFFRALHATPLRL